MCCSNTALVPEGPYVYSQSLKVNYGSSGAECCCCTDTSRSAGARGPGGGAAAINIWSLRDRSNVEQHTITPLPTETISCPVTRLLRKWHPLSHSSIGSFMTNLWKSVVVLGVVMFALLAGLTWVVARAVVGQFVVPTYEGYYAPVYSPDGQYVYFIERRTSGTTRQTSRPSIMMDNPPKFDVSVTKDTFSLKRLHVRSGKIEELVALAPSPLEGRSYESVGNRVQFPFVGLKFTKDGQLEFSVCLKTARIPTEKEYALSGVWTETQRAAKISGSWKESGCGFSGNEWPLLGDWELEEVHGEPDYFSVAIVAYNHVTKEIKPLVKSDRYHGVTLRQVEESSRRQEMERLRGISQTREELEQKYKAMGMGENERYFRILKDMQNLGYYPKPTMIVARRLSREEAASIDKNAVFSIAKDEMESGIFLDIEKAVARPGEEIERYPMDYLRHRDYSTSARLNAYLQAGNRQFYVRYLGETYELTIKKA